MDSAGRKLVEHWAKLGLPNAGGCSEEALRSFEKQTSVVLPGDMREYLRLVNGMRIDSPAAYQDSMGFSFWPLARIRWVPEEVTEMATSGSIFPGAEEFYAFADYLDWSWAYAIRLVSGVGANLVILIGKEVPEVVAGSFSDFVNLYLLDSPALYKSPPLKWPV